MKEQEEIVRHLAEQLLETDQHYIAGVSVSSAHNPKVLVKLDGDEGVTIDACANLSRQLGNVLEEQEVFEGAYTLEVSSPGIDEPLEGIRQYRKNIGRKVEITTTEGKTRIGKIEEVSEEGLKLYEETGKRGRLIVSEHTEVPFSEIQQTKVIVSFK